MVSIACANAYARIPDIKRIEAEAQNLKLDMEFGRTDGRSNLKSGLII